MHLTHLAWLRHRLVELRSDSVQMQLVLYCAVLCFKAVVLEGKYWKRRLESVTAEYKKWRRFYMEHALYALTNEDKLCMEEVCPFEHMKLHWLFVTCDILQF